MYTPSVFQQADRQLLLDFIQQHPFANLISLSNKGLEANHLPMLVANFDGKDVLQTHIAKANPLWKSLNEQAEVLVIFNGPHCYISPNHYPTKKEHGRAVPTWNYQVVQVKGKIKAVTDPHWLYSFLERLSAEHEVSQAQPWSIEDAPSAYIEKMLPAIIGLEITVTAISGQWKLSQNQPAKNIVGLVDGLAAEQNPQSQIMADLIKQQNQDKMSGP